VQSDLIAEKLVEGTILEGPHFGEPVRVLLAKARGGRVEIVAEGVNTKKTWKKLLKAEDFESSVTIKSSGEMRRDDEAEAVTVEVSTRHEESQGRKPVSVEKDNCGWDITSLAGGQVARYIEVKGRAGDGDVCLTENEWIKAQRFGKDYWLYIVTGCKSEPKLHMIQDPVSKLRPKEEVKIVRYMVGGADWKRAAATAETE